MFLRSSDTNLFTVGTRLYLMDEFASYPWRYKKFLYVASSKKKDETDRSMFGIHEVPTMVEGGGFDYLDPNSGYSKTYTHTTYGVGLKWSKEADEDELYGFFAKFPSYINKAARFTIETQGANVLNNGFTDTGPDASSLFATDHPSIGADQANRPSTDIDLGFTSLQAGLVNISNQDTWEGHPIDDTEQKTLWIHPDNRPQAVKLLGSSKQAFTGDNTMNYLEDSVSLGINPYISTAASWFLIGKPRNGGLMWFWRVQPYVWTDFDPDTLAKRIRIRMRFSQGYTEWHGNYGTSGT